MSVYHKTALIEADLRLEGGATEEDSSSGSLDLLRRFKLPRPRFAAELLCRRGGELYEIISLELCQAGRACDKE